MKMAKFVSKPEVEGNADLSGGSKWIKRSHTREIGKFMQMNKPVVYVNEALTKQITLKSKLVNIK
jgi:hypothetical protein